MSIEKAFPSIKVYYIEEEPGCEVFNTNDANGEYFPYRYLLDNYEEPLYYETIEEAAESVSGIVGHKVKPDYNEIVHAHDDYTEKQDEKGEDVFFSFHEFEVVDDNGNKVVTKKQKIMKQKKKLIKKQRLLKWLIEKISRLFIFTDPTPW
jgi:hypothetical protein